MEHLTNEACDALFGQQSLERKRMVTLVLMELDQAEKMHPSWPGDQVHRAAIVAEEAGELVRASLQNQYEGDRLKQMRKEAVQTGAMALRFLTQLPAKAFVMILMLASSGLSATSSKGGGEGACQVGISTSCHSMCVPGTFKIDTATCGWFVMSGTGANGYTWRSSQGQVVNGSTIAVYPGNPGTVTYSLEGRCANGDTGMAVITITNVLCANGVPQWVGIKEELAPAPLGEGEIRYFDLYGKEILRPFDSPSTTLRVTGEILIEVVGNRRRKVVFE